MTQDTEDVVARVADALAKLPCRDFEGIRQGEHELDMLRRREAARAAIEATDRQSLSDRIDGAKEAFHEALRRYPDAQGALVFFWTASGFAEIAPTDEQIAWAKSRAALHQEAT